MMCKDPGSLLEKYFWRGKEKLSELKTKIADRVRAEVQGVIKAYTLGKSNEAGTCSLAAKTL